MDMRAKKDSAKRAERQTEIAKILFREPGLLMQWCELAGIAQWGISAETFAEELARCVEARFQSGETSVEELNAYLGSLRLEDLGLACACASGVSQAWEHFVRIYRGYLRVCAATMLKRNANAPEAEELADSLFAELYGLSPEKQGSLLRYFHGRSSLRTWLRAVLAQRHVDKIRASRKFEELEDEDSGKDGRRRVAAATSTRAKASPVSPASTVADPHRAEYLLEFTNALQTAFANLDPRDADRLRMYYAEQKKLAEIGRSLGEHESSVSRHLDKVRRDVRNAVEAILRAGFTALDGHARAAGMSDAEITLCFEYAAEDAPIDLDKLFSLSADREFQAGGTEIQKPRRRP